MDPHRRNKGNRNEPFQPDRSEDDGEKGSPARNPERPEADQGQSESKGAEKIWHLAASLKIGIAKGTFSGKVYVDPNYRRKAPDGSTIRPAKYAHLVEFGTSQKSGASLSKKTGKLHRWLHSATQAKPFLRPALEEGKKEAFKILAAAAAENFKKLKPGLGI